MPYINGTTTAANSIPIYDPETNEYLGSPNISGYYYINQTVVGTLAQQFQQLTITMTATAAAATNAFAVFNSVYTVGSSGILYSPENEKKKALAKRKARALLRQFLTKEQWAEYTKEKHFHVLSQKGHLYQLRHGRSRNIKLIVDGKIAATYCIHPNGAIPDEDTLLAQKFLLEANEDHFLKTANAEWHTLPIAEAA